MSSGVVLSGWHGSNNDLSSMFSLQIQHHKEKEENEKEENEDNEPLHLVVLERWTWTENQVGANTIDPSKQRTWR